MARSTKAHRARLNVSLSERLLDAMRELAYHRGTTLTEQVDRALRTWLVDLSPDLGRVLRQAENNELPQSQLQQAVEDAWRQLELERGGLY